MEMEEAPVTGASLLERLASAANGHDLDALAASVGDDAPETAFADAAE